MDNLGFRRSKREKKRPSSQDREADQNEKESRAATLEIAGPCSCRPCRPPLTQPAPLFLPCSLLRSAAHATLSGRPSFLFFGCVCQLFLESPLAEPPLGRRNRAGAVAVLLGRSVPSGAAVALSQKRRDRDWVLLLLVLILLLLAEAISSAYMAVREQTVVLVAAVDLSGTHKPDEKESEKRRVSASTEPIMCSRTPSDPALLPIGGANLEAGCMSGW